MSKLLSKGATGKILYSIAWERYEGGKILPQLDYTHAADAGDAWKQFYSSIGALHCRKIIAIAPAIGYHVDDSHGDKLTV
jgi:hypothetical protein